jgi:hypothetical protein
MVVSGAALLNAFFFARHSAERRNPVPFSFSPSIHDGAKTQDFRLLPE